VVSITAPKKRRKGKFDFLAKRRREIVSHAQHVGAAETDDFDRWLVQWAVHNPGSRDEIWAVMNAARRMGGEIAEVQATTICDEAALYPHLPKADPLAKFLGVTFAQRQALGLQTIGSVDVKKRARKELRKRRDRKNKEKLRRARGMRPQSQSLTRTKPWEKDGVSRRTWERRRNKARDATLSTPIFLSCEDRLATSEMEQGCPSEASPRRKQEVVRLPTACTLAADGYAFLPLELRLLALGLPLFAEYRAAA
jgi:hypothetical protein